MKRHTTEIRYKLRTLLAATISVSAFSFTAMPAHAGKRKPAPIVYAGQGASTSSSTRRSQNPRQTSVQAARVQPQATATTGTEGRKVEFRYPDQPDRFYGVGGVRSANEAAPLSFSSSQTAISETAAREYANAAPEPLADPALVTPKDPAITAGGFDARAAAARNSKRAAAPVRAQVQTQPTAPAPASFVSAAGVADFSAADIVTVQSTQAEIPVSGATQTPRADPVYDQTGPASVFDADLDGQPTANGEILDMGAMIAAHPTLPLPSLVQVINLETNAEMVVRVNDRGPFDGNGLIELSERAATVIGVRADRPVNVRVRYLGPAPVAQSSAPNVGVQTAPDKKTENRARPAILPLPPVIPELAGGRSAQPVAQTAVYSAPKAASGGGFFVQLGSFSSIANAQRLHTKVAAASDVEIVPVRVNGADFFRVMAGPVANRQDADLLRSYIANQGIADGVVINPS